MTADDYEGQAIKLAMQAPGGERDDREKYSIMVFFFMGALINRIRELENQK